MNDTLPYTDIASQTFPKPKPTGSSTSAFPPFEAVKPYLSSKPLRRSKRSWLDRADRADLVESERRLADPAEKPIPYDDARAELGLE
jgi:hypothetical protein